MSEYLLSRLQEALNKIYGNTLMIEDDIGYDEYFCIKCKERVYEQFYNHKNSVCYSCFWKEED